MVRVMLDSGHDINTPGKRALDGSMKEFEFNRAVTEKVYWLLEEYEGVELFLSHDLYDGIDDSLKTRTDKANKLNADCFISIHANAGATSARGIETFVYPKAGQETVKLASLIHEHVLWLTKQKNRGIKTADFAVLRDTNMKSALLELGFFTNTEDLKLLKSDSYRALCAEGIASGLIEYYGLKKKAVPVLQPQPTLVQTNGTYKVQVGAFSVKDNADRLAAELKGKGYSVIVVNE
ncbi:N-acetylmuramoyl-L-alanine amidase [Neobacillus niacini]|uniref:N-acetylmuramoyl-L-alanine amidase n=1 Tax=Neobacillus niacini TaxID=86668 RepID=UPI0027885F24|nr:N-acetylmuramoyl-L-alanine amidase [Neobacillus niacini]MDQ1003952.1 N-acetylmuramoyl-L-alanine amidase [Neobacillus niacini]